MPKAEIIAIGSELLTPEKIDTNSLWFTEKLNELGVELRAKTIAGDEIEVIKDELKQALQRSDIIILTGGLGPTEDDVTRQAVAEAIQKPLIFDENLANTIREKFMKLNRPMPEANKRQAFVIEGSTVLTNEHGTAPGIFIEYNNKKIIVLPGPPRENQPMFESSVLPILRKDSGNRVIKKRVIRVSGMGESAVDEAIAPIYSGYQNLKTSILFNRSEIEIHLTVNANSIESAQKTLEEVTKKICEKLGIAVFSTNGETMEEVVGRLLKEKNKTLAVAESCTGGLISMRLTEIPGASSYFLQGVVAYANEAKVKMLDVAEELINRHGAVSAEVAEAMAKGVRERAGSDYGISVTGIAGPTGASPQKPIGLVFIGYADDKQAKSLKLILPGDRHLIRWRASQAALDYLRRQILKSHTL
ncbi:MAG: competence/damage-inducible protein A [Pyrinomonadaceae bacterium]|nr:competence/damage-inducible protein A [Pyrinomonadaceae bacterium]MCX7639542.1 competence/damage-inducible protein A [Pyrinomonadaceae bacterium]MDW8304407.1 competence/damage-inducible protein A [Acidobacteriota bacterium]